MSPPFQIFQVYDGLNSSFQAAQLTLRLELLDLEPAASLQQQLDQLLSYGPGAVVLESGLGKHIETIGKFFEKYHVPAIQIGAHCGVPA